MRYHNRQSEFLNPESARHSHCLRHRRPLPRGLARERHRRRDGRLPARRWPSRHPSLHPSSVDSSGSLRSRQTLLHAGRWASDRERTVSLRGVPDNLARCLSATFRSRPTTERLNTNEMCCRRGRYPRKQAVATWRLHEPDSSEVLLRFVDVPPCQSVSVPAGCIAPLRRASFLGGFECV